MGTDITAYLGLAAGLTHLLGFGIYNKQMFRGESIPNVATWFLSAFIYSLNLASYFYMTLDLIKIIMPLLGALACIGTLGYALARGKLSKPSPFDLATLPIGVTAALVWFYFRSATYANLILQVAAIVAIVPTLRGVKKNPLTERALPWFVWSFAYTFLVLTVLLRPRGSYLELVYPAIGIAIHASVGYLARRRTFFRPPR
ncbi:MAG: hypothetical protein V1821_00540 [bacterium]